MVSKKEVAKEPILAMLRMAHSLIDDWREDCRERRRLQEALQEYTVDFEHRSQMSPVDSIKDVAAYAFETAWDTYNTPLNIRGLRFDAERFSTMAACVLLSLTNDQADEAIKDLLNKTEVEASERTQLNKLLQKSFKVDAYDLIHVVSNYPEFPITKVLAADNEQDTKVGKYFHVAPVADDVYLCVNAKEVVVGVGKKDVKNTAEIDFVTAFYFPLDYFANTISALTPFVFFTAPITEADKKKHVGKQVLSTHSFPEGTRLAFYPIVNALMKEGDSVEETKITTTSEVWDVFLKFVSIAYAEFDKLGGFQLFKDDGNPFPEALIQGATLEESVFFTEELYSDDVMKPTFKDWIGPAVGTLFGVGEIGFNLFSIATGMKALTTATSAATTAVSTMVVKKVAASKLKPVWSLNKPKVAVASLFGVGTTVTSAIALAKSLQTKSVKTMASVSFNEDISGDLGITKKEFIKKGVESVTKYHQ